MFQPNLVIIEDSISLTFLHTLNLPVNLLIKIGFCDAMDHWKQLGREPKLCLLYS